VAAISGQATVDTGLPETKRLSEVLEFLLSRNQEQWIPDVDDYLAKSDALPQLVTYFRNRPETKAFWARVLKDEEGVLGIMAMESGRKHFIAKQQFEVLTILCAQTSIALRNAQLYARVPFVGVWERVKAQGGESRKTQIISAVIVAALVVLVFLIPNPFSSISGTLEVAPGERKQLYTSIEGTVERVLLREGAEVKAGELIARFDTRDIEREIIAKQAELEKTELQLAAEVTHPDPLTVMAYRRIRDELALAKAQLESARIASPIDGIIMTPKIQDLEGKLLRESDEVAVVAGIERLRIEISVSEKDLIFLRPIPVGLDLKDEAARAKLQKATLKISAFREESFAGVITEISTQATRNKDGDVVVIATIEIDNPKDPEGQYRLKPGMTGRAEIEIEPMTLAQRFMHSLGW
jgi:multidrug efflux pump subunit AcrA (membrane-fusion protein)